MDTLFQKTNAYWARYSAYEYRKARDGHLYLMPTQGAKPSVYDPIKDAKALVVDALNIGRLVMKRSENAALKAAVLAFVSKYGLLGFMTGLPTIPDFINYDAVYLPKNHFIKSEVVNIQEYLAYFFPFGKPDILRSEDKATRLDVGSDRYSNEVLALFMTFMDEPVAVSMSVLPIYAERYEWLVTQFRDWAAILVSSFLFYEDSSNNDDFTRELYQRSVSAFGGQAPTYHIRLYNDRPKIVWDFHSLLLTVQTLFGFALTDEAKPLRLCRHCNQAFIAGHANAAFCSPECKNQFNVYKNRKK